MSDLEGLAEQYVMNWIDNIDSVDVAEFVGSRIDFHVTAREFDEMIDGVMDAINRVNNVEFRKS